jgi:hypothetical protein
MVVFSSPVLTNAAYCVAEMYIQTALNGKIFPRCWLHSGLRKIYSSQLVSARNKKVTRKKWVCSCPNILDLLASKMINQLVWGTKRERDFFGEPMWNCSLFKKKRRRKKKKEKKGVILSPKSLERAITDTPNSELSNWQVRVATEQGIRHAFPGPHTD